MTEPPIDWPALIARLVERHGSQAEIGRQIGVHRVVVNRWAIGTRRPTGLYAQALLRLARQGDT